MKRVLGMLAACVVGWSVSGLTREGPASRELFNGRDLSGWYTYLQGKGCNCDPDGDICVTDGVIRMSGRGFGALVSEETFSNYRLRVEYRFLGGEQFGWKKGWAPDSGILFHSTGRDRCETKIASNENPIGEWNVAELVCRGDEVTAIFNGKVVNRGFGAKPTSGRIQLQMEGCPIEFRRVTLDPLLPKFETAAGDFREGDVRGWKSV